MIVADQPNTPPSMHLRRCIGKNLPLMIYIIPSWIILVSGLEGGTPMKITRSESIIVIIVPEIIKQTSGIAF